MIDRKTLDVEDLHRLHSTAVYRYIYRRVPAPDVAAELANDVFRIAWQRGIAQDDAALPWLLVTARNLVANEQRSTGRRRRLESKARDEALVALRSADHGPEQIVRDVLDKLSARDREVLMLAYWDGLRGIDLAELLDCTVDSAKTRLSRARKAFARLAPRELMEGGTL